MGVLEKVLYRSHILGYLKFTIKRKINNTQFLIPCIGGVCVTPTEEWFTKFLARFLNARKGVFIDVGVNLGQTLMKVKCIDPDQAYLGFEVNLACASYVTELIAANGFTNTTILPIGLAERTNVVTVFGNSEIDNSASIIPHFRESSYKIHKTALVARGDDVLAMFPRQAIGVIKIDVEGAEMEVLTGFERALAEFQPIVTCEILPIYDADTSIGSFRYKRHEQVFRFMESFGYRVFRMRHDSYFEEVHDVEVHSDLTKCDYAFVPAIMAGFVAGNCSHG